MDILLSAVEVVRRDPEDLEGCETLIVANYQRNNWLKVGAALLVIHDTALFKKSGADSFSNYISTKADFGFGPRQALRLLAATKLAKIFPPTIALPTSERQVRALVGLEPRKAIKTWVKANLISQETGVPLTHRLVESVLSKNIPESYRAACADWCDFVSPDSEFYRTPYHIVAGVKQLYSGVIDLDPCSDELAQVGVQSLQFYSAEDDGLQPGNPWTGRVYVFPPVGMHGNNMLQGLFLDRAINEYKAGRVTEVVLLLKVAIGQKWFAKVFDYPHCFLADKPLKPQPLPPAGWGVPDPDSPAAALMAATTALLSTAPSGCPGADGHSGGGEGGGGVGRSRRGGRGGGGRGGRRRKSNDDDEEEEEEEERTPAPATSRKRDAAVPLLDDPSRTSRPRRLKAAAGVAAAAAAAAAVEDEELEVEAPSPAPVPRPSAAERAAARAVKAAVAAAAKQRQQEQKLKERQEREQQRQQQQFQQHLQQLQHLQQQQEQQQQMLAAQQQHQQQQQEAAAAGTYPMAAAAAVMGLGPIPLKTEPHVLGVMDSQGVAISLPGHLDPTTAAQLGMADYATLAQQQAAFFGGAGGAIGALVGHLGASVMAGMAPMGHPMTMGHPITMQMHTMGLNMGGMGLAPGQQLSLPSAMQLHMGMGVTVGHMGLGMLPQPGMAPGMGFIMPGMGLTGGHMGQLSPQGAAFTTLGFPDSQPLGMMPTGMGVPGQLPVPLDPHQQQHQQQAGTLDLQQQSLSSQHQHQIDAQQQLLFAAAHQQVDPLGAIALLDTSSLTGVPLLHQGMSEALSLAAAQLAALAEGAGLLAPPTCAVDNGDSAAQAQMQSDAPGDIATAALHSGVPAPAASVGVAMALDSVAAPLLHVQEHAFLQQQQQQQQQQQTLMEQHHQQQQQAHQFLFEHQQAQAFHQQQAAMEQVAFAAQQHAAMEQAVALQQALIDPAAEQQQQLQQQALETVMQGGPMSSLSLPEPMDLSQPAPVEAALVVCDVHPDVLAMETSDGDAAAVVPPTQLLEALAAAEHPVMAVSQVLPVEAFGQPEILGAVSTEQGLEVSQQRLMPSDEPPLQAASDLGASARELQLAQDPSTAGTDSNPAPAAALTQNAEPAALQPAVSADLVVAAARGDSTGTPAPAAEEVTSASLNSPMDVTPVAAATAPVSSAVEWDSDEAAREALAGVGNGSSAGLSSGGGGGGAAASGGAAAGGSAGAIRTRTGSCGLPAREPRPATTGSPPTDPSDVYNPRGSVLVYIGKNTRLFCQVFSELGHIPGYNAWAK